MQTGIERRGHISGTFLPKVHRIRHFFSWPSNLSFTAILSYLIEIIAFNNICQYWHIYCSTPLLAINNISD